MARRTGKVCGSGLHRREAGPGACQFGSDQPPIPTGWASRQMIDLDAPMLGEPPSIQVTVRNRRFGLERGRHTALELDSSGSASGQQIRLLRRRFGTPVVPSSRHHGLRWHAILVHTRFSGTPPIEPAVLRHLARGWTDDGTAPVAGPPRGSMPGGQMRPRCRQTGRAGGNPHRADRPRTPHGGRWRQARGGREGASDPSQSGSSPSGRPRPSGSTEPA